MIQSFTFYVGVFCLSYLAWKTGWLIWNLVRPGNLQLYNSADGSWALVTGSSDGIGDPSDHSRRRAG